jgi:Protein of unknown function (DUF3500)
MKNFLISLLLLFPSIIFAQENKKTLEAARIFLKSLDEKQLAKATFPFEDEERFKWFFVPIERKGLPLREMSETQKASAIALLKASVNKQASEKAIAIMQLEIILKEIEKLAPDNDRRHPEKYYFTFFGKPDAKTPWAWRIEGHHVSLNFSSVDGKMSSATPMFFGSNPARVPSGPNEGKEIMKIESDLGFQMVASLTEAQQKQAILSETAPNDIYTFNNRKAKLDKFEGISFAEMTKSQQQLIMKLVGHYVNNFYPGFREDFMAKIEKAGLDKLYFTWMGSKKWGTGHYYRIHNPVLLIEYDNTQTDANHVHTVVRDITNDFGDDALMKHYKESH